MTVSHSHRSPDDEDLNPRYRLIVSSTSALDIGGHIEGLCRISLLILCDIVTNPPVRGKGIWARTLSKILDHRDATFALLISEVVLLESDICDPTA